MRLPPFEIRPTVLDLKPNDSSVVEIIFNPAATEDYSRELVIVSDNCQLKEVVVTGTSPGYFALYLLPDLGGGRSPQVELVSVEGNLAEKVIGEVYDKSAQHLMEFQNLNPYTYVQRTITVKNCK